MFHHKNIMTPHGHAVLLQQVQPEVLSNASYCQFLRRNSIWFNWLLPHTQLNSSTARQQRFAGGPQISAERWICFDLKAAQLNLLTLNKELQTKSNSLGGRH